MTAKNVELPLASFYDSVEARVGGKVTKRKAYASGQPRGGKAEGRMRNTSQREC
jgi:hypothetical protein